MTYGEFVSEEKGVARFVESLCVFTNQDEGVFTFILHKNYLDFCLMNNYPSIGNIVKFSETLKKVCGSRIAPAKWRDKAVKDGTQNGYKGIKLR